MDDDAFWDLEGEAATVAQEDAAERAAIQAESGMPTTDGRPGDPRIASGRAFRTTCSFAGCGAETADPDEDGWDRVTNGRGQGRVCPNHTPPPIELPGPDAETWVDPRTGEVVERGTKGAVLVEPEDPRAGDCNEPGATGPVNDDANWLPDYFTRKLSGWAAEEAILERQHARRLAQLRANRVSFNHHFLDRVKAVVRAALPKKRRSVDYSHGRLGFRKGRGRYDVVDKERVLEWAAKHAPEAVKQVPATTDLLKSGLPADAQIPGARWLPPEDRFYDDVRGE